jgi:hypothetical protein
MSGSPVWESRTDGSFVVRAVSVLLTDGMAQLGGWVWLWPQGTASEAHAPVATHVCLHVALCCLWYVCCVCVWWCVASDKPAP